MAEILLFGGTVEGRILAEYLNANQKNAYVCVATDHGEQLLPEGSFIQTSAKRLNEKEIAVLIENNQFDMVLDATHPFAVLVSDNIRRACEKTGLEYIRVLRETKKADKDIGVWVNTVEEAVHYLKNTTGNILITTGSKELKEFTKLNSYEERCYVRVLSTLPVVEECIKLGFHGSHLICMQGPFRKEMNLALLKQVNANYLVTKESGSAGGYEEKIEAAIEANAIPIVIGRPKETKGYSINKVKELLNTRYDIKNRRKITILGVGMGDKKSLTLEGVDALNQCQLIIGSRRILDVLVDFYKEIYVTNQNEEIVDFIKEHEEYQNIVVAFSGDIGFYSGAKRLRTFLKQYEVHNICGISSPVYFLSKLGIPWEDVRLISLHGRDGNLIEAVKSSKKVFALLGGEKSIIDICKELIEHHLEKVKIAVGENLSYENERITIGLPEELVEKEIDKMAVLFIENSRIVDCDIDSVVTHGIPDEAFIRGKIPMTKCEVRSISLSKLKLSSSSVVYDVGAGTGSVSIEAALLAKKGRVYAIEKKSDGINLIKENKLKFEVDNLEIIEGEAAQYLEGLPIPTHAFIGGTSGNSGHILEIILKKNPSVLIVMNVIALETLSEVICLLKELPVKDVEIVQVSISKGKEVGSYHLMMGQNPVYVISFKGQGEEQ